MMARWHSVFYYILIFVLTQLTWLLLLGLWIYWYITNYSVITKINESLSARGLPENINTFALVIGLVLLALIAAGMSLIFKYLHKQIHLNRLYDNFIGNITHELKSPLASIQLYLETMKKRNIPSEKKDEFINLMLKDTTRLNSLITSILEISAMEKKKDFYNYQVYPIENMIPSLIHESLEQMKIDSSQVKISGEIKGECAIDKKTLLIVFNNIFDNAVKYSVDKLFLEIRFASFFRNYYIEIKDNGIGIEPKEQNMIFKKFHRVYHRAIPNVKGTGLGLYWSKEIIDKHGGKLTVKSQGIGKGSTFRISLPFYQKNNKLSKRRIKVV